MKLYAFVDAQKTDFKIKTLCRVVGVSTSGYYQWLARVLAGPTRTETETAIMLERIRVVHQRSKGRYGEPRVTATLARQGITVNHKRVARLMATAKLTGRRGRRKIRTKQPSVSVAVPNTSTA